MLEDRIEAKWIDAKTATGLAKAAALIRMTSLAGSREPALGDHRLCPLPLIDSFHARGVPVGQVYAATETAPSMPSARPARPASPRFIAICGSSTKPAARSRPASAARC
jgi:hypothetical protein